MSEELRILIQDAGPSGSAGGMPPPAPPGASGASPGSMGGSSQPAPAATAKQAGTPAPAEASGEAAEAEGAAGGAAAGAGPAGAALVIAQMVDQKIRGAIQAIGQAGGKAGGLDTGVLADVGQGIAKLLPFGDYLSEASKGLQSFVRGLDQTAERLSKFSGPLAAAEAVSSVAQTVGDARRAQYLGPELAEFVRARSELEQKGQDLLAKIIKPLIPLVTQVLEWLSKRVEVIDHFMDDIIDGINTIITGINATLEDLHLGNHKLGLIAKNTEPKPNMDFKLLDDLLQLNVDPALHDAWNGFFDDEKRDRKARPAAAPPAFGGI